MTFNKISSRHLHLVSLVLLFSAATQAKADFLDVNLSNDAAMAHYLVDMGQGFYAGGGILHEEDAGQIASLDVLARDELRSGEHAFTAGVGGKLFGVFTEGSGGDGGSLALGGFVNYQIPTLKALGVRGEFYYGPSVTSINNVDGLVYYTLGVELEVIERAKLTAGYRKVEAKYEGVDVDMDEGGNVGVKLEF